MAGEPAIRKVLERLRDWLDGHLGAGVALRIDRAFDESWHDDELPAVNLRCQSVEYSAWNYTGGWLHDAAVMFDIITRSATTQTIDDKQAQIAAAIHARLNDTARGAEPGTFGELVQDCLPVSMSHAQDELNLSDYGENTMTWRITFLTPLDSFTTIAGHNGLVA